LGHIGISSDQLEWFVLAKESVELPCLLLAGNQALIAEEFPLKIGLQSLRPLQEQFHIAVQRMQLQVDVRNLAGLKSVLARRQGLNSYNAVHLLCFEV
jgi:hypothetical protein